MQWGWSEERRRGGGEGRGGEERRGRGGKEGGGEEGGGEGRREALRTNCAVAKGKAADTQMLL